MKSVTIGVSGKTCNISLLKLNKKKKREKLGKSCAWKCDGSKLYGFCMPGDWPYLKIYLHASYVDSVFAQWRAILCRINNSQNRADML